MKLVKNKMNKLTKEEIVELIKSQMGYLFNGGEFPYWLDNTECPFGAYKEYQEAKDAFERIVND